MIESARTLLGGKVEIAHQLQDVGTQYERHQSAHPPQQLLYDLGVERQQVRLVLDAPMVAVVRPKERGVPEDQESKDHQMQAATVKYGGPTFLCYSKPPIPIQKLGSVGDLGRGIRRHLDTEDLLSTAFAFLRSTETRPHDVFIISVESREADKERIR